MSRKYDHVDNSGRRAVDESKVVKCAIGGTVCLIGLMLILFLPYALRGDDTTDVPDSDVPLGGQSDVSGGEGGTKAVSTVADIIGDVTLSKGPHDDKVFRTASGYVVDDEEIAKKLEEGMDLSERQQLEYSGGQVAVKTGIPTSKWDLAAELYELMIETKSYINGQYLRHDAELTGELMPQLISAIRSGDINSVPEWNQAMDERVSDRTFLSWCGTLAFIISNDMHLIDSNEFENWSSNTSKELVNFMAEDLWDAGWGELRNIQMHAYEKVRWSSYDINYCLSFTVGDTYYMALYGNKASSGDPEYFIIDVVTYSSPTAPGIMEYIERGEIKMDQTVNEITDNAGETGRVPSSVTSEPKVSMDYDFSDPSWTQPWTHAEVPDEPTGMLHGDNYEGEKEGYVYVFPFGYFPEGGNVVTSDVTLPEWEH